MSTPTLPAPGTPSIEVTGLTKRLGRLCALDGLDLRVTVGSVHGFLGPNGAGKSTTIRVLLGMYRRDGGTVRVLGADPAREATAINRRVGDVALWPALTGAQTLDAVAALRGARDRAREAELIEAFSLDPSEPVRTYSKGNRQKVALVAALAAPVELLILDEPNSGLDPLQQEVLVSAVGRASGDGATVLLSSHVLERWSACAAPSPSSRTAAPWRPGRWRTCGAGAPPRSPSVPPPATTAPRCGPWAPSRRSPSTATPAARSGLPCPPRTCPGSCAPSSTPAPRRSRAHRPRSTTSFCATTR